MRPTYLSFENLKGRDGQFELKPVNCFVGPNGIGKSTVLWAVEIALLGYHPKLGKQNQATAALMGDKRMDMNVCLRFDDETSNQISWTRKSDGDVKKTAKMNHDDVPDIMFDLRSYLGMTNKERIKLVSDKIAQADISFDEAKLLEKLKTIEVIPATECARAIEDLTKFTEKSVKTRNKSKQSIQEWLSTFAAELTEEKKRYATLRQQSSSQMVGLRPSGAAPKSVDDKLRELYDRRGKIQTRLTELTALQKQISQTSIRRTELEKIIALAVPDTSQQAEFSKELTAELSKWSDPRPIIEEKIRLKKKEIADLDTKISELESLIVKYKENLASLSLHQKCPFCRSNRQGWKTEFESELKGSIVTAETNYKDLATKRETLVNEGKALRTQETDTVKEVQDITAKKEKRDKLNKEIADAAALSSRRAQAEAELKGMTNAGGTVDAAELEKLQIELDKITTELTPLEEQEKLVKTFSDNKTKSATLEKDLIAHQTREEVFKKAAALILEEQETIVENGFESILVNARKFTDDILPGQLLYLNGVLGMQTNDGWVSHEVMGTTHQTIAYIGVSIALAQQSPTKIVILDEAGIIHPNLKPAVITRLLLLASQGVIDAAFLTDPTDTGYASFLTVPEFQLVEIR